MTSGRTLSILIAAALLGGAAEAQAQRYTPTPRPTSSPRYPSNRTTTVYPGPRATPTPAPTRAPDRTWGQYFRDYGDAFVDGLQEYYSSDYIHNTLGAGGIVNPLADVADGVIHVGEAAYHGCRGEGGEALGHLGGACEAGFAFIPIVGDGYRGGKLIKEGVGHLDEVSDGIRGAGRIVDNVIDVSDLRKLRDSELRRLGIDAHDVKRSVLGSNGNLSRYDLFVDPNGMVYVRPKNGGGDSLGELVGHIDELGGGS